MMYLMITAVLLVFILLMVLLLLLLRGSARTGRVPPPTQVPEFMSIAPQVQTDGSVLRGSTPPGQLPPQQPFPTSSYVRYSGDEFERAKKSASMQNITSGQPYTPGPANAALYARSQPGLNAPPPNLHSRIPARNLEAEYEQGMHALYDPYIGGTNFVITNVVMKTPAEVAIAFQICTRKIQVMLRQRGLERAPLLTDIAGLVIGGDATTAWGQALKVCLDTICIKVGKDTYVLAHYNSRASKPNQAQLQEKIRSIQFMTSAVLNNFQSNIFDTREEAVAFLLRMKEIYHIP